MPHFHSKRQAGDILVVVAYHIKKLIKPREGEVVELKHRVISTLG